MQPLHALHQRDAASVAAGKDTGVSILFGAKAPILEGAQMSLLTIPFMKAEAPYDNIKEVIEPVWEWWMEEGKNRERLGELIQRQGIREAP